MGTFLSLVGLFICYWFDKYLLLRRYVVPFYLDKRLANTMMSMLPKYTVYKYLYIYNYDKNLQIIFSIGNLLVMCIPVLKNQSISSFIFPEFYSTIYFYIAIFGVILAFLYRLGIYININININ